MPSASLPYPLLEDDFMKNVILVSFTASTPVAAVMYSDMITNTGGVR